MWECECVCGTRRAVRGSRLGSGRSQSCGCLHKEIQRKRLTGNNIRGTHGMTKTPEFRAWTGMIQRCYNANHSAHPRYGGRGIKVCDRWVDSFENFFEDMGARPRKGTLDRIDNNGDYTPENCRWATRKDQANNRSSNHLITACGETKTISEWAKALGTSDSTIRNRIRVLGWSKEDAVTTPVRRKLPPIHGVKP